jgi:putative membrane protein
MRLILVRMARFTRSAFWRDAATIDDSATLHALPGALLFGVIATVIALIEYLTVENFTIGIEVTAFEIGGAVLGTLLVLRTNEGLHRWWEARKLLGGITNQCRSIAVAALAYGPDDPDWRRSIVRWAIVFAHVCRRSLRGERDMPEVVALIGRAEAERVANAEHMPSFVALVLAEHLRTAVDRMGMDRFAFLQADRDRAELINHIGGCEKILTTPLPRVYSIQIRRFIFLFLIVLPFGLIPKFLDQSSSAEAGAPPRITAQTPGALRLAFVPLITFLVAFPLISLDRIGSELQNPFWIRNLGHLDLDGITGRIERNLRSLVDGPIDPGDIVGLVIDPGADGPVSSSLA